MVSAPPREFATPPPTPAVLSATTTLLSVRSALFWIPPPTMPLPFSTRRSEMLTFSPFGATRMPRWLLASITVDLSVLLAELVLPWPLMTMAVSISSGSVVSWYTPAATSITAPVVVLACSMAARRLWHLPAALQVPAPGAVSAVLVTVSVVAAWAGRAAVKLMASEASASNVPSASARGIDSRELNRAKMATPPCVARCDTRTS